jgi:hypothetical protein
LLHDVLAHRLVKSGEWPQFVDPVRVGQEAAVQHHVGVARRAVLEAEAHDIHGQPGAGVVVERVDDALTQGVHVHVRRVDNEACLRAQVGEKLALPIDAVDDPIGPGEGMDPAGRFVALHQRLVAGLEEHDQR